MKIDYFIDTDKHQNLKINGLQFLSATKKRGGEFWTIKTIDDPNEKHSSFDSHIELMAYASEYEMAKIHETFNSEQKD